MLQSIQMQNNHLLHLLLIYNILNASSVQFSRLYNQEDPWSLIIIAGLLTYAAKTKKKLYLFIYYIFLLYLNKNV